MKPGNECKEGLRAAYEGCHPDDTLEALKHRAAFSKEDRLLLEEWRAAMRARPAAPEAR